MAETTLRVCPGCGKSEGLVDSRGRWRKFCSQDCRAKVVLDGRPACLQCGAKMHHGRVFCSRKCQVTSMTTLGQVPCFQCGTSVVASYSTTRSGTKSDKKFCSRGCYDLSRAENREKRRTDCPHCGASFIPNAADKYCSELCWLADKKAKPKNCVNCNCLFTPVKPIKRKHGVEWISVNGAKTCGRECYLSWISNNEDRKQKISAAFSGDKHPNWKGGATWRSNASYRGYDWKQIAESVRKRDDYQCRECGMTQAQHQERFGTDLNVHHIEPFHNFPNSKMANRRSNLITLCRPHHSVAEAAVPSVQMTLPLAQNRHGMRPGYMKGERHYAAKLTRDQVLEIRRSMAHLSLKEVVQKFGVSIGAVSSIRSGKSWKDV